MQRYRFWSETILAAALLIFIILKIPALSLPYFWDELGVYSQAALYLHDHTLSLLPSALPPGLSRGHPLLFSFINALSFEIFGASVFTGHCTSLAFSIALLISIYMVASFHFSKTVGLISVIFIMVQPVFFAQSVMMLPEVSLALFIILSVHFWSTRRYLLYALVSSAAILIKETAVVIPAAIFLGEIILSFLNQSRINYKLFLFGAIPLFLFGIFLFIQKQQNGWYFFPLHESTISFNAETLAQRTGDISLFLFLSQGRFLAAIFFLLGVAYFFYARYGQKLFSKANLLYPVNIILVGISYFMLYADYSILFLLLFYLTCMVFIITIKKLRYHRRMPLFLFSVIVAGIAFNSLNFFMNRYSIYILSSVSILFAAPIAYLFNSQKRLFFLLIPVLAVPCFYLIPNRFNYDEDMGYTRYLSAQQEATVYVLGQLIPGDSIFANFPIIYGLKDNRLGFMPHPYDSTYHILESHQPTSFNYAVIAQPGADDHILPPGESLQLLKVFENYTAKISIYTLKFNE